jgi:integrase
MNHEGSHQRAFARPLRHHPRGTGPGNGQAQAPLPQICRHQAAGSDRMRRLISEIQGGTYLQPDKTTLAAFLDRWLEHQKSQVSPRSHERYAELCRKNIAPLIGSVILNKLRPAIISAAWTTALATGHRRTGRGLSAQTVSHMHTVLKNALGQAVRWQLLARNPADAVDPPRIERKQMKTYDLGQTAQLLDAIRSDRMLAPVMLATLCGMRRAEIVALRWGQVDLAGSQLAFVQSA